MIPKSFAANSKIRLAIGNSYCLTDSEFTYNETKIDYFSPSSGSLNTPITIVGKGFSPNKSYNKVNLGDIECDIITVSDTSLTFTIPEHINFPEKEISLKVGVKEISSESKLKFSWYRTNYSEQIPPLLEGFIIEDNIYYGLGGNPYDSYSGIGFFKYNIPSNTVIQLNSFTEFPVMGGLSFEYGNEGYMGLGINKTTNEYNKIIWKYEANSDYFIIDQFLFVGLGKTNEGYSNRFWKYDLINDSWQEISNFPANSRIGAAVFVQGKKAFIGYGQNDDGFFGDFWEYDPVNNSWNEISSPNSDYLRSFSATFTINDISYLVGGTANSGGILNQVFSFDSAQNKWSLESNFGGWTHKGIGFSYKEKGYIFSSYYSKGIWEYNPEIDFPNTQTSTQASSHKQ
jgi:hypothetical protein